MAAVPERSWKEFKSFHTSEQRKENYRASLQYKEIFWHGMRNDEK